MVDVFPAAQEKGPFFAHYLLSLFIYLFTGTHTKVALRGHLFRYRRQAFCKVKSSRIGPGSLSHIERKEDDDSDGHLGAHDKMNE
jgi:hypothetical protein